MNVNDLENGQRWRNTLFIRGIVVVLLVLPLASSTLEAQGLSDAEAALLTEMDSKTIADALELYQQIDGWRKDIAQLRKTVNAADKAPRDLKAAAAAIDAVLKIARRLQTCSPTVRKQIGFEDNIAPLLKRLDKVPRRELSPDDFPDVDPADLQAIARSLRQAALVKQIADELDKSVLDAIQALRNPAQFASDFIEQKLKDEYFKKPVTIGGFTFQIDQKNYSTSVFSAKADIAILITQADTGATVKAHGLYFKYQFPVPQPVTRNLKFDTPGVENLLQLVQKNLPPIGPISLDKEVPVTVDRDKIGKVSKTHFGIRMEFTELEEVGLANLSVKVKVAVSSSGKVTIDAVKGKFKIALTPPLPLGQTTLLVTDVIVGLSDKNEIELGMTIATVAGGDNTLYADITATIGFPIAKKGLTLDGHLFLNKDKLAHVTGTINKTGLTVSMDSDAITGGTGKLTIKGTLTKQGLDATAQFHSLYGLATAQGTLHLGTDGHGSLVVSAKEPVDVAEITTSFGGSFTPGFKNLMFRGAVSIDLPDPYLNKVTAEVDITGQLLPSPRLTATGHIGPIALGPITAPDFGKLIDQLKRQLLDARQQFYKFLADTESQASRYADQRTQVFSNWLYQNAKNVGLDKLATGNPVVDKALGNLSQQAKDAGGTTSQIYHNATSGASDAYHHYILGERSLSLTDVSRSATISTGTSGGFGLFDIPNINKSIQDSVHRMQRTQALLAQLEPLTRSLDLVVVHQEKSLRDKSNTMGQVAGLRMRTSRVVPHANGDHDADLSFLVQVTSFRYTIDRRKGAVSRIARSSKLYVVSISLHNLVGKGHKPTAEINLLNFDNVSPWNAVDLLREELRKRIDAKLGAVQLTDRFEERRLLLQNLTDEPITAHVQVESKVGSSWRWLPAGPGTSMKSWQVTVPARKVVPVTLGKEQIAQGRTARIWASSASGHVWIPYATHDVVLVREKDDAGQTRYYGRSLQNFVFWFAAPRATTTTLHERLVSVRNQTHYPVLVTAEVAVRKEPDKLEWQPVGEPTRVPPESTLPLHYLHHLPLRGAAIRFRAEDEKKQNLRWVSTWEKASGQVDAKGYSAPSLGTALLVLEPPQQRPFSVGNATTPNIVLHFPAEQVLLPAVKNMPLQKAKKLLEEKGFRVVAGSATEDRPIVKQIPDAGWERYATVVRLATNSAEDSHLKPGRVPPFKGMTLAHAQEEGAHLHLVVKARNVRSIPTRPTKITTLVGKTLIDSQEPAAGTEIKPNEVIEVSLVRYVAEGTTAQPSHDSVVVPNLKHKSLSQAQEESAHLHLLVKAENIGKVLTRPTRDRALAGKTLIESQEPAAERRVQPHTVIEVVLVRYVADGPSRPSSDGPVRVPNFTNLSLAQAQEECAHLPLVVKAENIAAVRMQPTRDRNLVGKTVIERQEPATGAEVKPHTAIVVFLVRYVEERPAPAPPDERVVVPSFKNLTLLQAETEGKRHRLVVRAKNADRIPLRPTRDRTLVGKTLIENQEPSPETKVKPNAIIEVFLVRYVAEKAR